MVLRSVLVAALMAVAGAAQAQIVAARYDDPTMRYDHGVLGDAVEYGALVLKVKTGPSRRITLPPSRVFEDIAPRLADVDGDGAPEVITVESDLQAGARLAIYDEEGLVAATPFIGRRHRWLAPVGEADLDGDGAVEIVYIDRPHLAKTLRVWRFSAGRLTEIASRDGLTNHRIGDPFIQGRIATCAGRLTILTANADWTRITGTTLADGKLKSRDIAPYEGQSSFDRVVNCN
ncbi:VCBS repeat-containing protein [Defluviimonas aestuarii]|uniref:FG-GAP repeat domain-containing protein n=1 Tax=Albidovulum aestuarii TaxID=1130726 RepID=UPI002499C900|nr:VCBS repeat-containing protein [Defluviimonas aestuarii]MDI3335388.1 VCBS repeat-containing protein [Defluviimonas aestuarii]